MLRALHVTSLRLKQRPAKRSTISMLLLALLTGAWNAPAPTVDKEPGTPFLVAKAANRDSGVPGDADNAGVPDGTDIDDDNDGIPDTVEGTADTDGDGVPDSQDIDSDNDGISDLLEAGGVDTNGDGRVDGAFADGDGDGLATTYDPDNGGVAISNFDNDGDGVVNALDTDSDNDGLPDVVEALGTDANNDGNIDGFTDTDADGFSDAVDGDVGNDGTAENTAGALIITGPDPDADGIPNSWSGANADGTGIPNPFDLDSDGDGIPDVEEAGISHNIGEALASGAPGAHGWSAAVDALPTLTPTNTDGDGYPNYLDIDSDNDGITDNVEAQLTNAYRLPTGNDTDGDGIDDEYDKDNNILYNYQGLIPVNFQGAVDALPDYIDPDTDDDGRSDIIEGHDADLNGVADYALAGTDIDGDGLDDAFDLDNTGPNIKNQGMNAVAIFGFDNPPADPPGTLGSRGPLQENIALDLDRSWRTINAASLPITLLQFRAEKQEGNKVVLQWKSENQSNFKEFVLERSVNSGSFTAVATIKGKEGVQADYSFVDNLGSQAVSRLYYRLRQVDNDGRINYSRILNISFNIAGITFKVAPNPARDYATISVSSDRKLSVTIHVTDNLGRLLIVQRTSIEKGDNIVRLLNANTLQNGTYFVTLIAGSSKATQKFMVQQ